MSTEWLRPPSRADLLEQGKNARQHTPRSDLAKLARTARNPLAILAEQDAIRLSDLVALRAERMSASPFAFYRGTAALMAADFADAPHSGIMVASCGDAHVSNFGFYASAQRNLMFDLNDFDEAAWAPWEWDVKRLVGSIVVAGQATNREDAVVERAVRAGVRAYARSIRNNTTLSPTERYFTHFNVEATKTMLDRAALRAIRKAVKQATRRTGERAVQRITETDAAGKRRFVHQPPTTTELDPDIRLLVDAVVDEYRRSASSDIALLFEHFAVADVARRVVGVGSVGTRCDLVLLQDGEDNTLLMQAKQASESVLAQYGRITQPETLTVMIAESGEGARVVAMQRILQALSDPFLGHAQSSNADLYIRQFHDMKGGIEVEALDDGPFVTYAQACAGTLARAHSQSVSASVVAGYIGNGRAVADALLEWSLSYAAVSLADYRAFVAARSFTSP
ncbi:hypothetical protein DC31_07455 [Microbacterium sp. CH12i]|uniref:DUF2252 domain-containing protein n=1 Tax=Microbacterium sp. CH12i TaxID=1479651 RepID=UPI0004619839|nr:DUF2252 domain-containing protein [Microbacterium sp. CH12i]KDA06825.1 hypothetical protein DC31_07455 [Microbacterium sp. CH12i]